MNKRVLRKFAIPSNSPNPKNGIFCADQVKYVVRTAIKNIDHQRTLVLYIYAKESVLAGNPYPSLDNVSAERRLYHLMHR